jgi:putative membrane protein
MLLQPFDRFMHDGWWWWPGMLLPFLLFLVLIGVGIWAVVRLTSRPAPSVPAAAPVAPPRGPDPALEEVRLRYARGEIDRDEFVQRSRDLGGTVAGIAEPPAPGTPSPPG